MASLAAVIAAVNSGGVTGELKSEYRGHRAITRDGIAVAVTGSVGLLLSTGYKWRFLV